MIDRKILKDDAVLDGGIAVKMADGSIAVFSYFSGGYMHITLYTAPKTFYDNTAIDGKDAFLFGFNQTNAIRFEVYGQNDPRWSDVEQLKYNSWGGCYKENTSNGHPLCTRLLQINGWKVPDVLLSGNPKLIREWQDEQAIARTRQLRPGLLED